MFDYKVTIDTSGYKKVVDNLPKAIERCLYQIGVLAVEGATRSISGQYTPSNHAIDTGRLKASISFITATQSGDSGFASSASQSGDKLSGKGEDGVVIVGTNVNYAEYVHDGTTKMVSRPFLREGIDEKKSEMQERVKDILEGDF